MNESSRSEEYNRSYYGWVIVGVAFLAQLLTFGLVYSFGVFFKPLTFEFHWSRAATAGPFFAYAIVHDILAPVTGRLTDRFGPRVVAALGGFCIGLAMFLMSHASAIWHVYLFYAFVFSIGIASIYAPLMATVSQWFREKRGLAVGITATGLGAGSLIFSPLAAWLISCYGWRIAYIAVGAICWVGFIPVIKLMRRAPPKKSSVVAQEKESLEGFSAAEAFRTKAFWMLSLAWLFIALALWAIMVHIVPLLTDKGISLIAAGTVAGTIGGVSIVGRVGMGWRSDKLGRKRGLLIGVLVQLAGTVLLLFCQEFWMFFLFAVIFGLGVGAWAGVLPSLPADLFGSKATATVFGWVATFAGIGVGIGPLAAGRIFDITGSYYYMIWMCIIASIIGIVFCLLIKPPVKSVRFVNKGENLLKP